MTVTTSRRAILAGAAALPALSITVAANTVLDAQLMALGKQFDALEVAMQQAIDSWRPLWDAFDDAAQDLGERGVSWTEFSKQMREAEKAAALKHPPATPHPDDISDAMDAPMRRIMALPATTIDGLKVKAWVARFACNHFWDESDDNTDWDQLMARKFIDAVLNFRGGVVS